MNRILCLWLPQWPVQRRVMQEPALAGQAVAVHAASSRRGRQLLACSPEAQRLGLQPDMPLSEASIVRRQRAAPLQLLPHDAAADLQQLSELAEYCTRFSPLTGWRTTEGEGLAPAAGPDCLLLDVSRIAKHFGGESALLDRVFASLQRRGLRLTAGLAPTVGAAWAAARYQPSGQEAAWGHRWVVTSIEEEMYRLPPAALRLPGDALELLGQLGIATLAQFAELPRDALAARFGQAPLVRWDQFLGRDSQGSGETILAHKPAPAFTVQRRFDSPVSDRRAIELVVRELTTDLCEQLKEARRGALKVCCRLDDVQGQTTRLEIGLFEPSMDEGHMDDLLQLQLESTRIESGVERIWLAAPQVSEWKQSQGDLFGQSTQWQAASQLVDRLRQRLGQTQVVTPQLRSDAQPERAVAYAARAMPKRKRRRAPAKVTAESLSSPAGIAAAAQDLSGGLGASVASTEAEPLHRPLALGPPEELVVFSWRDDLPHELKWQGGLVEVLRAWGPERIETGWWRGRSVRRDYFRVELRSGERLWIFCQLNTKQWYLHGWYC